MKPYRPLTVLACLSLAIAGGPQTSHAQQGDADQSPAKEQAAPEKLTHLSIGDPIPKNLLEGVTWIQGDEVKSFDEKGKIVASMHPALIKDEMIESLLSGEFDPHAHQTAENQAAAHQAALMNQVRPLIEKNAWEDAKPLVQQMADSQRVKPMLLLKIAIAQADWQGLLDLRNDAEAKRYGNEFSALVVDASVVRDAATSEGAADYAKNAIENAVEATESQIPEAERKLLGHFRKARFAFMLGEKEDSLAELKTAEGFVDQLDTPEAQAYFGDLVKAASAKVHSGSFPQASMLK